MPDYRIDTIEPSRLSDLTHLLYFSTQPTRDGTWPTEAIPAAKLAKLKSIAKTIPAKIIITVGGWERSAYFPVLTQTQESIAKFVTKAKEFCLTNQFGGIDYDWEHPKTAEEVKGYAQLVKQTKAEFASQRLEVSVAQAGWQELDKELYEHVDRINLMAYDHDFPQATFDHANTEVEQLTKRGCPPNKIALGVPFYGRRKDGSARAFAELASGNAFDPAINELDGYAFNGHALIKKKCQLVQQRNLAGIMIWEVGQDHPDEQRSLLRAIRRDLSKGS